ncbi:hypothetical protein D3C87_1678870 [compost metagenome]
MVLVAQGDQNVFDTAAQAQRFHRLDLGAHDLGIARRSQVQVHATTGLCQAHAAAVVDQCHGSCAINGHRGVHALLQVGTHIVGFVGVSGLLKGQVIHDAQLAELLHQNEPEGLGVAVGQLVNVGARHLRGRRRLENRLFHHRVGHQKRPDHGGVLRRQPFERGTHQIH